MALTSEGFVKKTYDDVLGEVETRALELFGADTNISSYTPLGMILRVMAWFVADTWEQAENVYNSGFVTKAEGIQLDRLAPFFATSRIREQYATTPLSIVGTPGVTILEGERLKTENEIEFELTEDVLLDVNGNGTGLAYCVTPGTIGNVDANTITIVAEGNADIVSVTNPSAATGGVDYEENHDFLNRLLNSTGSNGSGTPDAIVAAVRKLNGVRSASIKLNKADVVVDEMPPHSFQVFTLGGENQEIADVIFKNSTGLQAYGTQSFTVYDVANNPQTVAFTPATPIDVYAEVTLTTTSAFEQEYIKLVQEALIKVVGGNFNGITYSGLNMGEVVRVFQLEKSLSDIKGIIDAKVSIGRQWSELAHENLIMNSDEVAQLGVNNVSVVIE